MPQSVKHCPRCQSPLGHDLGGDVCAACLLEEALPAAEGLASSVAEHDLGTDTALLQHFGPYELLEEIGRGGMGVIYKARQPGLDRIVALKMLLAGEFADAKARERLLREARIAARLTHPGIVTIHEVGEHGGRPYFAMGYVPGPNLAQLCREGLLPVNTAVRYAGQLAQAVHYAHQHGVIHRDLKPANILISPDNEAKLTDFGLTKSLEDPTRTIESAGSPNFMAPEQADSSLGVTGTHTDVFGLGAILYYLLTGRPPAMGESLSETLRAVVACEPVPPRQLRPALPRDLETLTLKCLEKEPARRYASAQEVAEELSRWQSHQPIHARPATGLERFAKWIRRRPAVAALSAAVMVSLLAGFIATIWQWRRAEGERQEALRHAYAADIQAASRVLVDHNFGRARQILERNRPRPGEPDLRGWEWRYLWQFCRGDAVSTLCQRPDVIFSVVPDPAGRWVAVGEALGGLTLWDPALGQKLFETTEPINRFSQNLFPEGNRVRTRVALLPGSSLLAYCASMDGTNPVVNLWNPATRRIEKSLPQPYLVRDLAFTRDGRRLLVTLFNPAKTAILWDLESGTELARYPTDFPDFSVGNPLAISPEGRFATFDQPEAMVVFDLQTGRERWRFPALDLYATAAAFSPDGKWLAVGNGYSNPVIQFWDLATGTEAARFEGHQGWVRDLLFTPDGTRLISASADQSIRVWDVATRRAMRTLRGHDSEVSALALSPDGKTLYSGGKSGEVLSWRVDPLPPENRGATRVRIPAPHWDFLPGGSDLLLTTTNRTVVRVRAPAFDQLEPFEKAGTNCIGAEAFARQPRYVVFHENGEAAIRNLADHSLQAAWHLTDEPLIAVGILPQTENLISITTHLTGQVTDPNTGQVLSRWHLTDWGFTRYVAADGQSLWVLQYDGSVFVTDLYTGQTRKRRFDHGNTVAVAFSPDRPDLLATCSDTGFVRLVSAATLQTSQLLGRYRLAVWSACFAPEERLASVGASDEDLKLWDLRTGRELLTLTSDQTHGNPVKVSPDGSTFVQRGVPDGDLFIWRAPTWEEIGEANHR